MKQAEAFLQGEGAAWLERNKEKLPIEKDPVIEAMLVAKLRPKAVLEVGCADGWRLKQVTRFFMVDDIHGVDPAAEGGWIVQGIRRATADALPYRDNRFDAVIYGFCLYLCDREDLFKIVTEGDRVLRDDGHLIIYDFHPQQPHSRPYHHRDGINSYKMDHAQLWLANPAYRLRARMMLGSFDDAQTSVTILQKQLSRAWPLHG